MRWIVWGAGSIGQRHLTNLLARGERDVVALRRAAVPLPGALAGVPVRTDLVTARGRGDAAVVICTPTSAHVADAISAVGAGCDVLIEKPLGDTLEAVDRLRAEARHAGRIVGVAYCLRFHPARPSASRSGADSSLPTGTPGRITRRVTARAARSAAASYSISRTSSTTSDGCSGRSKR